ncbi:STAS domain-containing protein [Phytohabitans houttuyneae]|uniref:STAS domain-containing protein n=1 Tax=Phytohabitans houttuyneae TaxID=1076126 RepID=A0A6V8JZP9_9ACTN|nr:STAS domain-containing protein [Phytohabitans houttuyneae]GFJ78313.1 hypothetical protein Phou_024930 [Phytohabitans houttuyneae]
MEKYAPFSWHVQARPDAAYLIVSGDLDYTTRDAFRTAVDAALTARPGRVVLDLTGVGFVSSEGVSALLNATRQAAHTGTTLAITATPRLVRRLDLFGVTTALHLLPETGHGDHHPGI